MTGDPFIETDEQRHDREITEALREQGFARTFFWRQVPKKVSRLSDTILELDKSLKQRTPDEIVELVEQVLYGKQPPPKLRSIDSLISAQVHDQGRLEEAGSAARPVETFRPGVPTKKYDPEQLQKEREKSRNIKPLKEKKMASPKTFKCKKCGDPKAYKTQVCPKCNPAVRDALASEVPPLPPMVPTPPPMIAQPPPMVAAPPPFFPIMPASEVPLNGMLDLMSSFLDGEARQYAIKRQIVLALGGTMPELPAVFIEDPVTEPVSSPPKEKPVKVKAPKKKVFHCSKCHSVKPGASSKCNVCERARNGEAERKAPTAEFIEGVDNVPETNEVI